MEATSIKARKSLNLPSPATIKAAFVKNSFMIMAVSAVITFLATALSLDGIAAFGAISTIVSLKFQL